MTAITVASFEKGREDTRIKCVDQRRWIHLYAQAVSLAVVVDIRPNSTGRERI